MALSFAWQRKKHSRLVSQELCPFLWGIGRCFMSSEGLAFFFSSIKFQNGRSWYQTTQQLGLVSLKLSAMTFFLEVQNATGVL